MLGIHFKQAFEGIFKVIKTQRNFRVQLLVALITILAASYLDFNQTEWLILMLVIALVLSAEMFNTAIEFLSDRVNNKRDNAIKLVKDISAGAVLTTALVSIAVGLALFMPKILIFLK